MKFFVVFNRLFAISMLFLANLSFSGGNVLSMPAPKGRRGDVVLTSSITPKPKEMPMIDWNKKADELVAQYRQSNPQFGGLLSEPEKDNEALRIVVDQFTSILHARQQSLSRQNVPK